MYRLIALVIAVPSLTISTTPSCDYPDPDLPTDQSYPGQCSNFDQEQLYMNTREIGFRIKNAGCYLDIGPGRGEGMHSLYVHHWGEEDVFWDCNGKGSIWNWESGPGSKLCTDRSEYCDVYDCKRCLEDDWDTGDGSDIMGNERNAKVDPNAGDNIIIENFQYGQRIVAYTNVGKKLVLQRDWDYRTFETMNRGNVNGCEGKWDFYNQEGSYNAMTIETVYWCHDWHAGEDAVPFNTVGVNVMMVLGLLMIINFACLCYYCIRKRNDDKGIYKKVNFDSEMDV